MKWKWSMLCLVIVTYLAACSKNDDASGPDTEEPPPPPLVDELGPGWDKLNTGLGKLHDVHFLNDSTGYVCGRIVARTTDRGNTWTSFSFPQDTLFYEIYFTDAAHGWAVSWKHVYITADSGKSWTPTPHTGSELDNGSIYDIQFVDQQTGFHCGYGGLWKSMDGGNTWAHLVQARWVNDFSFIDQQKLWYVEHKKLYRTQDGGANFQHVYNFPDTVLRVGFRDLNNGWAIADDGQFWKTVDGGNSWERFHKFQTSPLTHQFFAAGTGFVMMPFGIYEFKDGQVNRILSVPNHQLSDMHFVDESHGWAVSPLNHGVLYRYVK